MGEITALKTKYREIELEIEDELMDLQMQHQNLYERISNDLNKRMIDPEDFPIPEAQDAKEFEGEIYNSSWDELTQLREYKKYQKKPCII